MESFYLITPIALILVAIAIKVFLWAVNDGQFDDLDREASRILFDEDGVPPLSPEQPPQHTEQNAAPHDERNAL